MFATFLIHQPLSQSPPSFCSPFYDFDQHLIKYSYMRLQLTKHQINLYFNNMRLQNEEGQNLQDIQFFKTFKQKHYAGHKKCPTAMTWNTTGTILVTAQILVKMWLFSEENGLEKGGQIKGHQSNIDWAQFGSPNLLGTLSREAIKFWDMRESAKISYLKMQKRNKQDLIRFAWSNSKNNSQVVKLAVINKDNSVNVYDYRNMGAPLATITTKTNNSLQYCGVSWDRSNSVLFLVGGENNNGSISLFNGQTFESLTDPIITHCGRITDLTFSNDNDKFATVSQDSLLQIHNIPDIVCERVFNNKSDGAYRRVSFSSNGRYVAASSQASYIDIFNVQNGGQAHKIKCSSTQEVLAWHPKRTLLAYIDEQSQRRSLDKGEDSYLHLLYQ